VYASARRPATLQHLGEAGASTLALDVNDEASMRAAVATIEERDGPVGALVNNAGYSQSGAVEAIPIDRVRQQFETNVFGPVRLAQLVLPGMRRAGSGRIVNIGSMGGRLTFPGGGIYHATKYALEAISDALRFEVGGFGIDVVLVQPGLIRSNFSQAALDQLAGATTRDGAYAGFDEAVARATTESYVRGPVARLAGDPEAVAAVVERALSARRPRARYRVTPSASVFMTLRAVLPDALWDALMRSVYPRPGVMPGGRTS
jgi:NAD(P)-dependent dehydrogenase (short-subunit alcohol dehydrogenase family)